MKRPTRDAKAPDPVLNRIHATNADDATIINAMTIVATLRRLVPKS